MPFPDLVASSRALFLASLLLGTIGCTNPDEKAWRVAKKADTAEGYRTYLNKYPNGLYAAHARKNIPERVWTEAKQQGTVEAYERYLRSYPKGAHASEALEILDTHHWEIARADRTSTSYLIFLRDCPNGKHAAVARARLEEHRLWDKLKKDNIYALEQFLEKFPDGDFSSRAKVRFEKLRVLANDLKLIIDGKGCAKAPAYRPGRDMHRIMLCWPDGSLDDRNDKLPAGWYADSIEKAELLALLSNANRTVIEVVKYNGPSITRYRNELSIELFEASTGKRVANTRIERIPRAAGYVEVYSLVTLEEPITLDDIKNWLSQFVIANDRRF